MTTTHLDVAQFAKVPAFNEDGDPIQLSELWNDSTAALVFIRHFG